MSRLAATLAAVFALLVAPIAGAAEFDGAALGTVWIIPFAGILLSIALLPLLAAQLWHHHYGKIALAWALLLVVPLILMYGVDTVLHLLAHTLLLEYLPFIILLFALFTVSGGIRLKGNLHGSPGVNTALLGVGTGIASFTGTTGAAMLLIRPLLRANDNRRHNAHVVVFFIFLVANIGGSLTPLGDPPLFLGFLKGVDFFWTMTHMLAPMLVVATVLLTGFYFLDRYFYAREDEILPEPDKTPDSRLGLEGKLNLLWLVGVIGAVLLSGLWKPGIRFELLGTPLELQNLVRDMLLLAIAAASWFSTAKSVHDANQFSWGPIAEVAKLFFGIFITIIPAIAILQAGSRGALAPVVELVTGAGGAPIDEAYFWLTGTLSGFLDNAPTYLVFFNMAGGDAQQLMGPLASTLLAISAGAVFMGACTYIGNAPNFMVKAIAEERGIRMPSFFGFMGWSLVCLIPLFVLVTLLFFR